MFSPRDRDPVKTFCNHQNSETAPGGLLQPNSQKKQTVSAIVLFLECLSQEKKKERKGGQS